jgi:predicted HicB family RNase H-like nuclease
MSMSSNSPLSSFLGSNDLTNKIKNSLNAIKDKVEENKKEKDESLEEFILKNSKELVENGIDAINEIKQTVLLNPQSDEVEALAEIFKGVSTAINILKDIQITKMKSTTSKEIKQMDIDSKRMLAEDQKDNNEKIGLRMTRDEVFKLLKDNGDIVDADFDIN